MDAPVLVKTINFMCIDIVAYNNFVLYFVLV